MREAEHNPFSAPTQVAGPAAVRRRAPAEFTTPFRLFAWLLAGGALATIAGMGIIFATIGLSGQQLAQEEIQAHLGPLLLGGALYLSGGAAMIAAFVFQMILTYRAWELVQDGRQRTTPGRAVGFLFIPFFNLYWLFVAKHGLAKELNRFIDAHGIEARRPSPGAGLACATLMLTCLVPVVGWFVMLPALAVLVVFLKQIATTGADIAQFQADRADGAVS